jgi:hypothetical protein
MICFATYFFIFVFVTVGLYLHWFVRLWLLQSWQECLFIIAKSRLGGDHSRWFGEQHIILGVFIGRGVTGCIGLIIEATTDIFDDGGDAKLIAFFLVLLIGLFVASVALSTFGSGGNAVIVLFAEAPAEFQQNHPELSNRTRQVWSEIYPRSV